VLITELFEEYGLNPPHWKNKNGGTTLILPGTPKSIDLNDRMISFITKLNSADQFNREDYDRFFEGKISEKTARNDIAKLLKGNWIEKSGEGPATKYIRTLKDLPDFTGYPTA